LKRAFTRAALRALAWNPLSRATGHLAQWQAPTPVLQAALKRYIRAYRVDESEIPQPLQSYRNFNEFFTRPLPEGARPIDSNPEVMVSPVDGFILSDGPVDGGTLLQVKGVHYALEALVGSAELARRLDGGQHVTVYLSPACYHRIHSPVDGVVEGFRYLPGPLYPVNSVAVNNVPGVFARNERLVVEIQSENSGLLALVAVGATNVGSITATFDPIRTNQAGARAVTTRFAEPIPVRRGDELARFNMGSTVVLVWNNRQMATVPHSPSEFIRLGAPLGRLTQ
jgi:phosphatidylserine decarboxylase